MRHYTLVELSGVLTPLNTVLAPALLLGAPLSLHASAVSY